MFMRLSKTKKSFKISNTEKSQWNIETEIMTDQAEKHILMLTEAIHFCETKS